MQVYLTNVVATGRARNGSVDIEEIARKSNSVIYKPDKLVFALFRCKYGSANIYKTGKVVISAKSESGVYKVAEELRKIGIEVDDIRFVNYVANVDYCVDGKMTIDQFEKLIMLLSGDYDTSLLPAVTTYIYTKNGRCTAMVFNSGKTTITGCRSVDHVYEAARVVLHALRKIGVRFREECSVQEEASA